MLEIYFLNACCIIPVEWTFLSFPICKCMNTTVPNNSTVQLSFFVVVRLNMIVTTKRGSLIVIFNPFDCLFIIYLFFLENWQIYKCMNTIKQSSYGRYLSCWITSTPYLKNLCNIKYSERKFKRSYPKSSIMSWDLYDNVSVTIAPCR